MRIEAEKFYKILSPRLAVVLTTLNSTPMPSSCVASFISPVSTSPPILMVALAPVRHTYKNIIHSKEFVVNVLSKKYVDQMLQCAARYQEGVDKIRQAGLRSYSSKFVNAPRISEADAWIECRVIESKEIGDSIAIFGRVMDVEVRSDKLKNGEFDVESVNPVLHVGGDKFASDLRTFRHKRYDK
jgi:flavin reductase (DIM6/NTAB) family NADH-FMN oxidoreductase RutF